MKFIIIVLSLFLTNYLVSQNITTNSIEYCTYDEESELWTNCSLYNDTTTFFINEDQTVINHSTSKHKSVYYVKSKEITLNAKQEKVWSYKVISDTDNAYTIYINFIDKTIKCAYWEDGKLEGVMYLIASIY